MGRYAQCESKRHDPLIEPHKFVKNISENRENAILNAMNVRIEDRTPDVESFMNELEADPPVKRRYGNIKHVDRYHWPLWLKILVPVILVALLTLGTLLATGVIDFPSLFSDEVKIPEGMVIVPDVEREDTDDALKTIQDAKLLPSPEGNVVSDFVEAGKIVLQTPMGGSYLEENGKVVLVVSSGKGVVAATDGISTVPYVIWDTQEDAIAKLKQAGLGEPLIETKSDENVAAGKVISQSVEYGKEVTEGTQITLVVSTGPEAFDMPSVSGKAEKAAKETLTASGLVVSVSYEKNDDVAEGNVISQSVKAGTKVKSGDKVTLIISSGKPIVSVPNVVGKSRAAAKSELEKAGFSVKIFENYDNDVASGDVISQSPAAGSNQIKGSDIIVYVSKGKQPVTVTFNANGGSLNTSSITVYHTATYGNLPIPKRDYYTFSGWYTQTNGGTEIASGSTVSDSANHTLYAHWSENVWSDWVDADSTSIPRGAKTVDTRTVYSYQDKTTASNTTGVTPDGYTYSHKEEDGGSYSYGSWSDWSLSTIEITENSILEFETKTEYGYGRYTHSCGHGITALKGCECGNVGKFEEQWLDEPLTMTSSAVSGNPKIKQYGRWFVVTDYRTKKNYYDYGGTRTMYKSRSKTWNPSYKYYYYKWGSWSSYTTTVYTASDSRNVKTKQQIRYQEK